MILPKSNLIPADTQRDDLFNLAETKKTMESICGISSIFFSEFDNVAGPKITYEVPDGKFINTGLFDQISPFIIPKFELTSHTVTITAGAWKILGYPVQIDNDKYVRNALIFNLCFVFKSKDNIGPYESIVKKLGEYLRTVEMETKYLSSPDSKSTLPQLMMKLLSDLNILGRCSIELNKSNTLFLKVVPPDRNSDIVVHDYDVPVLVSNRKYMDSLDNDLTTRQIVPLIDGTRNVHQISEEVDADGDLVKSCVQNMMFYEIAKVVPAFSLTNVYRTTPEIRKLVTNPALNRECAQFIARDANNPPNLREIMIIFGDMQHGITVKNWMGRHSSIMQKIDEKKLCDFGMLHGLIRRVYKYPIYLRYNNVTSRSSTCQRFFNGLCHTDEIKLKYEQLDLDDKIEADHFICVCWK